MGLILLALAACGDEAKTSDGPGYKSCDSDSITFQVGAGPPTTLAEGAAQCAGAVIDPILTGDVRVPEPGSYTQPQLSIGSFAGWDPAWEVPGTIFGYHTGVMLWAPTAIFLDGKPYWPLETPLSLSLARFWSDPDYGCHDAGPPPAGTITFSTLGPVGGRIAGSFADVQVPQAADACPPSVAPGISSVVLSGTFDVTRVQ